ncbi:leucyl aminopeptidase [Hahella sp. CCB-MM4]|uniref:leucyl aminopeptidase n=1 Tax=Hahella sp. (strain CCB-MM4) TaxID=1926491 RepID=UPI000B9B6BFA|nr:leucyl aminopeptidase [Hahella sp. CCB-MM4]OZG72508.1 leucyl aminopeptidase [Hahella sp. CCB-MM4]
MNYSVLTQDAYKQKTDCLILGIPEGKTLPKSLAALDASLDGMLKGLFSAGDISSKVGDTSWVHTPDKPAKRLLFVGVGKSKELDAAKLRKAIQAAMGALAKSSATTAISTLGEFADKTLANDRVVEHSILALESALYTFDQLKSEKAKPGKLKQLKLTGSKADEKAVAKAEAIAKGIALTKTLGNLPGNICTPEYLAKQAREMSKSYKSVKVTVLDEKKMKELGMGSLLSVAAGSAEPPRLITMEYKGADSKKKPHVLVGKGITFDTGGISLKPGQAMDEMKYDMCGAASVFGTLTALAEMNAPINVVGVVAAAENMPGSKATKPGDIVTSMSGQTIEILNTDAEGRLVLCDALTYSEKFNPDTVVDIATLTGACIIALGNETTGLMANDDKLAQELLAAGQATGDRAWQLPLWDEYQSALDSNFADIQNIGDRSAGTITAACFLSRFTKKYRWAHLDIAGVAWTSGKAKGASGRPVPLLTEYLLNKL